MPMPRKPAALKTGHHESGSTRKQQIKRENYLGGDKDLVVNPPKQLNQLAKLYYKYIVINLKNSGILTNLDRFVVAETAICLGRMRQCDEIIDKQGLLLYRVTKNGYRIPYEHPAVTEKDKYIKQFKMLSNQIGLSPSSRSKLADIDVQKKMNEQDPLLKILNSDSRRKD